MAAQTSQPESSYDDFLKQFRKDKAGGEVQSLRDYLDRYPGADAQIARTFAQAEDPATTMHAGTSFEGVHEFTAIEEGAFGPYRIIEEIGRGGQGVVYKAQDENLHRQVALKVLTGLGPDSELQVKRFQREAEVAAKLEHPGICAVHDAGVLNGIPFIAMQFVEGETLATKIRASGESRGSDLSTFVTGPAEGRTGDTMDGSTSEVSAGGPTERRSIMQVVELVEKAARALHAAHEAGIIHRDIKPGNLMVTPDDEAIILDFGMAREIEGDLHNLTRSGDLFGTPAYMSPEQLVAQRVPLDRRTDIYSLGVTLYECLAGQRPFKAHTREALYQAILTKEPRNVGKLNAAMPADLRVVIATAMEKDRDKRYQTALDFADDLRAVREIRPIAAKPVGALGRITRWSRRRPAAAAVIALLIVGIPTIAWLAGYIIANRPAIEAQRLREVLDRVEDHLSIGYMELGEGVPQRALEAFDGALELKRDSPAAVAGRTLTLLRMNRPEDALATLDAHGSVESDRSGLQRLRVDALKKLGRLKEATALEKGLAPPHDAMDYFLVGSRLMVRGHVFDRPETWSRVWSAFLHAVVCSGEPRPLFYYELAHAAGHLKREANGRLATQAIQAVCGDTASAAYWRAFALEEIDNEKAISACRRAVELAPDTALFWNLLGNLHVNVEAYEEANTAFKKAIALDANLAMPWFNLGLMHRREGNLDLAIAAYKKAIELDPGYPKAWNNLGVAYQKQGRLDEALTAWEKLIELMPQNFKAHANIGLVLARQGHYDEAILSLQKSINLTPSTFAYYHLGNSLRRNGELESAIDAWKRGMKHSPDPKRGASMAFNMGNALQSIGEYEEAVSAYSQAIGFSPDHIGAHNNRGNALGELGRFDDAARSYLDAFILRPEDQGLLQNIDEALSKHGDWSFSARILAKASTGTSEKDPRILHALGLALLTSGDRKKALAVAKKAAALLGENSDPALRSQVEALLKLLGE